MRSGQCPKCGSYEIYSGAEIHQKEGRDGANTIPVGGLYGVQIPLDNFVCLSCGYVESYISDIRGLQNIRAKWRPINEVQEYPAEDDYNNQEA